MQGYNKVLLLGNLTQEPELKAVGETNVCKFSIAVNKKYRSKSTGEMVEEVSFFDIECWAKQAENSNKYLHKGSAVLIEGELKQSRWVTDSGDKRSRVLVSAQRVQFMPRSQESQSEGGEERQEHPRDEDEPQIREPSEPKEPSGEEDLDVPY